nr:fibronectin type III domain-containing protein [Tuberibacillus sp. Marseille-P3662]
MSYCKKVNSLEAPSGLASSDVTDTSLKLTWDPVEYADHYDVYRDGENIGTRSGTQFADSGLTASTTYSYQVKAVGANGLESDLSAALDITTAASGS